MWCASRTHLTFQAVPPLPDPHNFSRFPVQIFRAQFQASSPSRLMQPEVARLLQLSESFQARGPCQAIAPCYVALQKYAAQSVSSQQPLPSPCTCSVSHTARSFTMFQASSPCRARAASCSRRGSSFIDLRGEDNTSMSLKPAVLFRPGHQARVGSTLRQFPAYASCPVLHKTCLVDRLTNEEVFQAAVLFPDHWNSPKLSYMS